MLIRWSEARLSPGFSTSEQCPSFPFFSLVITCLFVTPGTHSIQRARRFPSSLDWRFVAKILFAAISFVSFLFSLYFDLIVKVLDLSTSKDVVVLVLLLLLLSTVDHFPLVCTCMKKLDL